MTVDHKNREIRIFLQSDCNLLAFFAYIQQEKHKLLGDDSIQK